MSLGLGNFKTGADSDRAGEFILRNVQKMDRYNRWLFEQVAPYLGETVLEAGSGIGTITQFILDRDRIIIAEKNPTFLSLLRDNFGSIESVEVQEVDLEAPWTVSSKVESVLCMNVLEHLNDDESALRRMGEALVQGGRMILLVPAFQALFGTVDEALQHRRRYRLEDVEKLFERVGLRMIAGRYLNVLGAIGWYVNGKWLKRSVISARQAQLFNFLAPLLYWEAKLTLPFGLSLLAVGEKIAIRT